ncbi:ThuA domain-containing protein [Streptomyces longispororuber]|uniref:ThuA domain-containing protein n=1 Tax=Streptomyces longispororuber TaxID=68230 RepID=UPI0036FF3160
MRARARLAAATAAATLLIGCASGPASSDPGPDRSGPGKDGGRVLVFSKTAGFRHDSIPDGIAAVKALGAAHGFSVDATENAAAFTRKNLARYDAVVWLSTTGDVLNTRQQGAFEQYIRAGGGYVGVHAAADTEYDWPFYGALAGAYFRSHPAVQRARITVEDHAHPATAHLGADWHRTDEWYDYRSNPRERARVLASLDESSYSGGTMGGDHPIAWCQASVAGTAGRSFYTGGGHTKESYAEPAFRQHLLGGIRYATGAAHADCRPERGHTPLFDGSEASLAKWKQAGPGSFALKDDGTLTSVGGMGMLWYADRSFGSYSLKLDWRMSGADKDDNSGVFVGFPPSDDPWSAVHHGYEIQIDATDVPEKTTGSVYGFRSADLAARDRALNPPGEWNTYEIRVEGERLRLWLNGVLINDFTNTDPARSLRDGHIGIQNHGADDEVAFRDIRLRELPTGRTAPEPDPATTPRTGTGTDARTGPTVHGSPMAQGGPAGDGGLAAAGGPAARGGLAAGGGPAARGGLAAGGGPAVDGGSMAKGVLAGDGGLAAKGVLAGDGGLAARGVLAGDGVLAARGGFAAGRLAVDGRLAAGSGGASEAAGPGAR